MKVVLALLLLALASHVSANNSPCLAAYQGFILNHDSTGAITTTITPIAFTNPLRTFRAQTNQGYHGATCLSEIRVSTKVDNSTGVPLPFTYPFVDQNQFDDWQNALFFPFWLVFACVYGLHLALWFGRTFIMTDESKGQMNKYALQASWVQGCAFFVIGLTFLIMVLKYVPAVEGHFTESGNLYILAYMGVTMVTICLGLIVFTTQVTPNMMPIVKENARPGIDYLSSFGTPEITKPLVIAMWILMSAFTFVLAEGCEDHITRSRYVASLLFMIVALTSIIQMCFTHVDDKRKKRGGLKFTEFLRLALVVSAAGLLCQKNYGWVYGYFNLADYTESIWYWVFIPFVAICILAVGLAFVQIGRALFNRSNETPIEDEDEDNTRNTNRGLVASAGKSEDSEPAPPKSHKRSKTPDGSDHSKKVKKTKKQSAFYND